MFFPFVYAIRYNSIFFAIFIHTSFVYDTLSLLTGKSASEIVFSDSYLSFYIHNKTKEG